MRTLSGLLVVAALMGCASAGSAPYADRNFVAHSELEPLGSVTVFEGLQRLRPEFLKQNRGRSSINLQNARTVVYIDNARFEELDALRSIQCSQVETIRFLEGHHAVIRFGSGHEAGAILVTMKGGR